MSKVVTAILAPTDFSSRGHEAIEYAAALAQSWGAPLILFHAHARATRPGERARLARARRQLEQLAGRYRNRGLQTEAFVRESSDPATSIIEMAEEVAADLIVMGTRRREKVSTRLFPGMTAAVTQQAKCPVLTAVPGGFLNAPVPEQPEELSEPLQRRKVWLSCPHTGKNARCLAIQHEPSGNWLGLVQCSLLDSDDPPQDCDAACMQSLTRAGVARGANVVPLRIHTAVGERRCWQCGSRRDLAPDPHISGVYFCQTCWERVEGEPHHTEDLGTGD